MHEFGCAKEDVGKQEKKTQFSFIAVIAGISIKLTRAAKLRRSETKSVSAEGRNINNCRWLAACRKGSIFGVQYGARNREVG